MNQSGFHGMSAKGFEHCSDEERMQTWMITGQ